MNRSILPLSLIAALALLLGYLSVLNGMSSLYQIGLINFTDRYDEKYEGQIASEQQDSDQSQMLEDINFLTQQMLNWNGTDPKNLSNAAYTSLLNSYAEENIDRYDYFVKESLELNQEAMDIRAAYPDTYAQQVYGINSLGESLGSVLQKLYLAERFGPYERATAVAGIDFYFGYWDQISNEDKIKASRYVLNPRKFGLTHAELYELIGNAHYKERVCNLLAFSGQVLKVCRK